MLYGVLGLVKKCTFNKTYNKSFKVVFQHIKKIYLLNLISHIHK